MDSKFQAHAKLQVEQPPQGLVQKQGFPKDVQRRTL